MEGNKITRRMFGNQTHLDRTTSIAECRREAKGHITLKIPKRSIQNATRNHIPKSSCSSMKMKIISAAFFCFTFTVAAATQDFLKFDGPFLQKLNSTIEFPTIKPDCIEDCKGFAPGDDCNSICAKDSTKFDALVNAAFQRVKDPICGITLGNIPIGEAETTLTINDRKCSLKGPLTVSIKRTNTNTVFSSRYKQTADWTIEFQGLTLHCPTGPDGGSLQNVGRVDVTVNFPSHIIFVLKPSDSYAQAGFFNKVTSLAQYLEGDPQGISKPEIQAAVEKTFNDKANIMYTLYRYFAMLSNEILLKCVIPTCNIKCPN